MVPFGRPRSVPRRPPCPECGSDAHVVAHGFREVAGEPRRAFRCGACGRTFRPGARTRRADAAIRAATRRVREETGVNYRLLARALTTHLGIPVSHATVGAWCREESAQPAEGADAKRVGCEYLSLLWAVRQQIEAEFADA